jgi:hypothetical protein
MTRRRKIALLAVAALILIGAVLLRWLLNPGYLVPRILAMAGDALGLEITASGVGEYRLRGTPQLTVRNLSAREPGAKTPLLRAQRLTIAVPWSTLRARGGDLTVDRLELDAPVLDLAALQRWLAKRPPSDAPLPTLTRGLRIVRGQVIGDGWRIENVDADLRTFAPDQPLRTRLRGRYVGQGVAAPLDVQVALTQPAAGAGIGVVGQLALETPQWRLPSQLTLSARLDTGSGFGLRNAILGAQSRYVAGDTALPFALGLAGPLRFDGSGLSLPDAGLSMRGRGAMPTFDAQGAFALGDVLRLQLRGALANWPDAWPALPPPLGQSTSPLPFALRYDGAGDFSDIAALELQRDATRFDAHFRLLQVLDWIDAQATGSPLPPIAGHLSTPQLEISGAMLEGVEVSIEDPGLPAVAPSP